MKLTIEIPDTVTYDQLADTLTDLGARMAGDHSTVLERSRWIALYGGVLAVTDDGRASLKDTIERFAK